MRFARGAVVDAYLAEVGERARLRQDEVGDAAIAGYGIGSRLEFMLVPISFGIGAALTALVGTNIGARQYHRAQRMAWSGALMAGGIAATIGIVVALWPDLWLGLFTSDPAVLASGRHYLSIVGPVYGFFGLAMALYFASQGTGEMVWPVAARPPAQLVAPTEGMPGGGAPAGSTTTTGISNRSNSACCSPES